MDASRNIAPAGTLTKNEMTVTHLYAVDDLADLTPHLHSSQFSPRHPDHAESTTSPAMVKAALIGNICNNAFRNETGVNVGQATEVALLNVLPVIGRDDERKVSKLAAAILTCRFSRAGPKFPLPLRPRR